MDFVKFTVILAPEAGGGFSAVCPALPGCISEGDSREDTLANIREAILLCLEVRKEQGQPNPVETPEVIAEEIRACLKDRAAEGLPLTIETQVVEVAAEVAAR
jgi:predicted RNase H-like HicB family nuclease